MSFPETEILTKLVTRVFRVDDVTSLNPNDKENKDFFLRYRGKLINDDSAEAYDQLADSLNQYNIMPLFRAEEDKQIIYLAQKGPEPKQENIRTNIILFVLTIFSVLYASTFMSGSVETISSNASLLDQIIFIFSRMLKGWPYAVSLLGILLAHEFGHYFMSRYHKTPASLPYFIPIPLPPLGTMGAAIIMRATPKNKRILFDIGVAGPIAGLVVAIPILFYGLSLSNLNILEPMAGVLEGNSILYLLAKYITFGQFLPTPVEPQGILYWLKYFFTGNPIPYGGIDVLIHPVAFAGWAGILVTALNLIPAGTLDGGHVIYALFGDKARKAFPFIIALLVGLGFFWDGWWLWAVLLFWLGRVHAQPLDQITTLDPSRKLVAVAMIFIFLLVFTPVPFMLLTP